VTGATSYNVYYGTATGVTNGIHQVTGATSPNAISGLLKRDDLLLVVTAVNGDGESAVSFEASATPSATPPPAAPSLTSATAGNAR